MSHRKARRLRGETPARHTLCTVLFAGVPALLLFQLPGFTAWTPSSVAGGPNESSVRRCQLLLHAWSSNVASSTGPIQKSEPKHFTSCLQLCVVRLN